MSIIDYLILQAGSVDVTNLDTKNNPEEHIEYFKQEVRFAAKNLFDITEAAFETQPSLEKVVVMNMTPQYDTSAVDPLHVVCWGSQRGYAQGYLTQKV